MKYIIYKITNNINGKIYIGKHKTDNIDDTYFGSGMALKHAIKKYGIENFTFHLEFELQNEEEMNLLEKYVVNEEFLKRNDVYNLKEGGKGGGFYSLKSREKMSKSHKGYIPWNKGKTGIYTEEILKKFSESKKGKYCGEKNSFYGKHHSDETKRKILESKTKYPVLQYTRDLKKVAEYKSVSEAERQTCINKGNISLCCLGKRKSAGGFVWKYKEYKTEI